MKRIAALFLILVLSFALFANTDTHVYTSLSHEKYRADYVGSFYNFSKAETTYDSLDCYTWEFGYKEQISGNFMGGISYGYSLVFFEEQLLFQCPIMIDFYYQPSWYYGSVSVGSIITTNDDTGTITTLPNVEVGIGFDIPIGGISIGVRTSASMALWCGRTNISDMAMVTKLRPLEIMFMVNDDK